MTDPPTLSRTPTAPVSADQRLTLADAARIMLIGLLGALIGLGLGNAIGASGTLGPLDVTTRLTVGIGSTFDIGVAAVRLDTPGPVGLAIIGNDVRLTGQADLTETLASFSDIEAVADSLLRDTLSQLAGYGNVGALIGLVLGMLTHHRLLGRSSTKRRRRAACAAAGWLAIGATATSIIGPSVSLASRSWTPVAGLSVEGQAVPDVLVAGDLLDEAVRVLQQNENFYQQLRTATATAMTETAADDSARGLSAFVFESDLHCNLGMARVISEVAIQSRAAFVLSGGDITMSGTQLEALCTDVYTSRLGATPLVLALGNHDSGQTGSDLEARGATVLRGQAVELDGLTVLGDSDPRRSQIGSPTTLRGDETAAEFSARIAELACDIAPDLLVVHDPALAASAVEDQCAPLVLSGHRHSEAGPTVTGDTVSYAVDNSGGTGENTPAYGPLATDTAISLFYYDPETGKVDGFRTVQFARDGSVTVEDYRRLNRGQFQGGD
ncbi:MAG: hypothetical protein WKF51_04475 [Geodermatophilaceae bacterium]